MSVSKELDRLASLPWSRQVVADEDGVFVASIPELEGCFADGDSVEEALRRLDEVLAEWLAIALEGGAPVPQPKRIETEEWSGRFSVRVPRGLHRRLAEKADREGCSLNQLVATILAETVDSARLKASPTDVAEDIASDAVRGTRESIGALKGIGAYFRDQGDVNLACLAFAVAADRVSAFEGAAAGSNDLGTAAALARRHGRNRIAEALWRESLRRNPENRRSSSALGQLMHHQGRYAEAIGYLEPASDRDNYALLFLGWSLLFEGREAGEAGATQRGLGCLKKALETWAYQNRDVQEREAWLRNVRRLVPLGPSTRQTADELVAFANDNAGWRKIDISQEVWSPDESADQDEVDRTSA